MVFCLSYSCNLIGYLKQALNSDWLFYFRVLFSLAGEMVRFRAQNSAILEKIALLRANQISRITSDFEMGVINEDIVFQQVIN